MDGICTLCSRPAVTTVEWLCVKYPLLRVSNADVDDFTFGAYEALYDVESPSPTLWLCFLHDQMWMRGEIPEGGG